ncbi:MAG TPA: cytochrome P450 [Solirubrobacteraceae bacterium]|jgi:cytochrome P450|nr:cytochrome P450 [Solirubrobacteraceae bacterium]
MPLPIGADVRLEQLEHDPHALLARLREHEPVCWIPALEGWLVTRHDLAVAVMRDDKRFTVEDPRFSTGQVVGASMLSLDGDRHARHRAPFTATFRPTPVRERFAAIAAGEAERLIEALAAADGAELRRSFAGPLAAAIVSRALGLAESEVEDLLGWYDAIVAGVTAITVTGTVTAEAAQAFGSLRDRLQGVIDGEERSSLLAAVAAGLELTSAQIIANAAVLLFGGIETSEGMIANAVLALLDHPADLAVVRSDPTLLDAAIDESLRMEPAAAVVDRYATVDVALAGAQIGAGALVRVSLTAANRDPAVFANPDRFDLSRANVRRHLAFAHGPHVCLGIHLARLEARVALARLLARFPCLRLDPHRPSAVAGLVFRKPPALHVVWD